MLDSTNLSRRALLQASAAGACALALGGTAVAVSEASANEHPQSSTQEPVQYGFLVGLNRCTGCGRCVEACREGNHLSDDTPDRRVISTYKRTRGKSFYISTACMHCEDPSCMKVCPAGAIFKDERGIVRVDSKRCIGCKYCYQACPYDVPQYNTISMDKCDCCVGSGIAEGEDPYCVRACKFGALKFGPIEELQASTNNEAVPIAEPNNPSCIVLGTSKG